MIAEKTAIVIQDFDLLSAGLRTFSACVHSGIPTRLLLLATDGHLGESSRRTLSRSFHDHGMECFYCGNDELHIDGISIATIEEVGRMLNETNFVVHF